MFMNNKNVVGIIKCENFLKIVYLNKYRHICFKYTIIIWNLGIQTFIILNHSLIYYFCKYHVKVDESIHVQFFYA